MVQKGVSVYGKGAQGGSGGRGTEEPVTGKIMSTRAWTQFFLLSEYTPQHIEAAHRAIHCAFFVAAFDDHATLKCVELSDGLQSTCQPQNQRALHMSATGYVSTSHETVISRRRGPSPCALPGAYPGQIRVTIFQLSAKSPILIAETHCLLLLAVGIYPLSINPSFPAQQGVWSHGHMTPLCLVGTRSMAIAPDELCSPSTSKPFLVCRQPTMFPAMAVHLRKTPECHWVGQLRTFNNICCVAARADFGQFGAAVRADSGQCGRCAEGACTFESPG